MSNGGNCAFSASQAEDRGFDPRHPLQLFLLPIVMIKAIRHSLRKIRTALPVSLRSGHGTFHARIRHGSGAPRT